MRISATDAFELIAALWADEYPLARRHFGGHFATLVRAMQGGAYEAHFAKVAMCPGLLEARLLRIEALGQTESIMSEVGSPSDSASLDQRLLGAWAELRTVDQLRKEGFDSIAKVEVTADLVAQQGEQVTAFQVTRISKSWTTQVRERSEPGASVDRIAYGDIGDIYRRLAIQLHRKLRGGDGTCEDDVYGPLSYYFWDAIDRKNADLRKWDEEDHIRCLVIVSNEEGLGEPMVRHVACRLLREVLHNWLPEIHFEELLWLPDAGNGAWFKVGAAPEGTQCFADWGDEPGSDRNTVCRREVDLDSVIPSWRS